MDSDDGDDDLDGLLESKEGERFDGKKFDELEDCLSGLERYKEENNIDLNPAPKPL